MKEFLYSVASGQRRDWVAHVAIIPLGLASIIYSVMVRVILMFYATGLMRRRHLSVPVVSIGNLTLGGVGKTPMVIYVARLLKARGLKVVVLTRGYMPYGQKTYASDEALILQHVLDIPVMVDPDRHRGGRQAIDRYNPDVILLDDGFQHWRLFRNLDIVLVDAVNPFGPGRLLPAGILREPLSSLRRADVLVITKSDQGETDHLKTRLNRLNPHAPIIESNHRPTGLLNIFTGNLVQLVKLNRPLVAFCGIGNPRSFEATLKSLNTQCRRLFEFGDHHVYTPEDMKRLKDACTQHQTAVLVTTQKDAVKLTEFKNFWQGYEVYSLNIEIDITQGEHEFVKRIDYLLRG